ncbi:Nectin-1 [Anabarilius grahami]|uniref:Nectin-1 n=1 Tax=Anabarilius grahami TaxID=495550 RepID=A0A3N0YUU1_ANAGA|nr:Nectin-1 [Anabarilius grahami]
MNQGQRYVCGLQQHATYSEPRHLVLNQTVTGILGEEVYLHCLYTGQIEIMFSSWNRLDSSKRSKKMAGYNQLTPFNRENFDIPASPKNLTVKLNVTSLDLEGDYTCVINTVDDEVKDTVFLRVIAPPGIDLTVKKEVVNRTLYHAVTCSASSAKPEAVIRWEISGALPRDDIFSVNTTNTVHLNGTTSSISVLSFPLIMNNESTVTCVVNHPAFTEPERANIEVETFVSPIMSMETVLVQEGGEDFQEVICTATGGKPHPNITWRLPEFKNTPPILRNDSNPDSVISSYRFPSNPYEGENVSCVFGYMFFPFINTRTITLPVYYLSSLQLKDVDYAINSENQTSLAFEEGDTDITIRMEILGNVPSYEINCSREGQPLPEDVDVVGRDIFLWGPVELHLAGQYLCQASYRRHQVSLQFTIEVNPKVLLPVTFPPNISVNVGENSDYIHIECLASNAVPTANVSWIISQEMNCTIQSNVTSFNGSYSVKSVLTVPNCMAREYVVECVVDHPAFMEKERRQIALPVCAPPNITLQSSIKWDSGVAYTWLVCSVQSQTPAEAITWAVDCHGIDIASSEFVMSQPDFQQSHMVVVQSVARIPIYSHAGCSVTCVVELQGLAKPENKSTDLPPLGPSASRVFLGEERHTDIWHAVCEYSSDGVIPNISWVLSDEDTEIQATTESKCDGIKVNVNSTFEFQLSQYEGKDLTCLIQNKFGRDERRTVHVPKYSISSIEVVNKTTLDRRSHGQHEHRLALQENFSNQKILLRAHGNAPSYKATCYREDGSAAQTVGMALVFTRPVSELDAGLYICHVSYHHHMAKVFIRVDVTSEETQHMIFITVCFTSAAAITLVLIIILFVLWKERESLAALMQDPRCPERMVLPGEVGPNYAELVHYSIVLDVKSTV